MLAGLIQLRQFFGASELNMRSFRIMKVKTEFRVGVASELPRSFKIYRNLLTTKLTTLILNWLFVITVF